MVGLGLYYRSLQKPLLKGRHGKLVGRNVNNMEKASDGVVGQCVSVQI